MSSENSKISKIKLGDSIYDISANWDNISDKPDLSSYAPKVSPALTGVPTAPTASSGNNTTQIATTAFVKNEIDKVGLSGAMHFRGVDTSGNVYSGSTIGTYAVNNGSTTNATLGDVLLDDNEEFVWTGNNWELLGPNISFKIQQSAVSDPAASGTSTSFISSISQDINGNITASKASLPAYPTKVSDLTNDSGFLTSHQDLSGYVQGNNKIYYGTCTTGASIQNKVVTCSGYTLEEGSLIIIRMSNAQNYNATSNSNISLNINNTGDINLKAYGTTQVPRYIWAAGEVIAVVYNGTNYLLLKGGLASTTYYGLTRLAASATSDNTTLALTPAALNSLVNGMVCNYPVYSKTTYAIGDRVRQNYSAWECNTTISTAEDWNASHWTELSPLQSQIDTKASLASPALTGVPTAPTASSGTNTTQIATTAFVNSAVDSAKSTSLAGYGITDAYTKTEINQLLQQGFVNVLDYGAKGDGETDDTAAIKQAIEENNFVIFPEGEYLTNGVSVANLSDRTLWARGAEVKFDGNGGSVFHFANCDNINIVGGTYKGMSKAKYGLNFVDSKNVSLDGVSVQNVGNSNTAAASGINFVGDCSYSKLNDVYIDGVTSGQSDGSYIFAHGIGFIRSSTTGHYSKYVEINHPVIKNVGYVNGENYVNATAAKDSDGEITGYMVGNNACKADIIEEIDGEYHARIDGDGIFLVQSRWGNVHDGIESYFKINNVDISRCSKRALKIAARCVDVDGGEIDVATWSAAVEVQRVRNNSLRNLNITDTAYTLVTINGGDGPMVIENCRITGGGMSSNGSGGIVLGAKSTGLIEGSEIVHIKNCVFDNVRFPIYAAINSAAAGKTDCEELVIKDCLIKHFYGDAAVKLEAGRYQRLGKLTIENVSFAYGTSTATVFFNNNNFYKGETNQSVPLNSRLFAFFSPEKTVKVMCDNLSDDFQEIFESYNLTTPNQIFEMPLQSDVFFENPDEQVKLTSGDYDSDGGSEFKASAAGNTILLSETSGETYAKGQRVVVPLESPVTVSPGERLFLTIYNSHPRTSSVNDLTVNFFTNLGATEGALSGHDENYGVSAGYTAYVKKRAYELSLDQSLTLQTMVIRVNAATTITEGTEITVSLKTEKGLKEIYTKAETEQLITQSALVKESKSNKVTSISGSSTNEQYPSALAVKNYVDSALGVIENGSY